MENRQKMYSDMRQELLDRQLSNTQNYDKAILSLSTAGLGFSLVFIRDVIPLNSSNHTWLLISSWILFGFSIVLTLLSFMSSQSGLNKQLVFAEKYYLEKRDEFINKRNWQANLTHWLFYISGVVFIAAIFFTIAFVITNSTGGN